MDGCTFFGLQIFSSHSTPIIKLGEARTFIIITQLYCIHQEEVYHTHLGWLQGEKIMG